MHEIFHEASSIFATEHVPVTSIPAGVSWGRTNVSPIRDPFSHLFELLLSASQARRAGTPED